MEKSFIQLHLAEAQKGLALVGAYLHLTPTQLSQRVGIKFETIQGDFGDMEAAVIRDAKGKQFGLSHNLNSPRRDYTTLLIFENTEDPTEDVNDGLAALDVDSSEVISFHPDFRFKPHLLWREDDSGMRYMLGEFLCRSDARNAMRRLLSHPHKHKQTYWIEKKQME